MENGYLVFDDYYIDNLGDKHYWEAKPIIPMIRTDVPAWEQKSELRALCSYLLEQKKASLGGIYTRGDKFPPLFRKDGRGVVRSIDVGTGKKFLKEENYPIKPESLKLLLEWLISLFPEHANSSELE